MKWTSSQEKEKKNTLYDPDDVALFENFKSLKANPIITLKLESGMVNVNFFMVTKLTPGKNYLLKS